MARDEDLTFGQGRDELLRELWEMPGFEDSSEDPAGMIAGVIWLDTKIGLHKDDDYVLVNGALSYFLESVKVSNPEIVIALTDETVSIDRLEELVTREPFEVTFNSSAGPEFDEYFPESIRGQTIRLRLMNEVESMKLGWVVTAHADGTLIQLSAGDYPATVAEANS